MLSAPTLRQGGGTFDRAPQRVYWEVTRACDLCCLHCRATAVPEADPAELDSVEGERLLAQLSDFGSPLPHLVFTGGDPFKRADLFSLIDAARRLGFPVAVAPSATPRLTAESIWRLRAAGVEAISLSLDGSGPARHDTLRGVPGCFARTVDATRECLQAGLPFQINTLVSEETLDDLPAIHRIVAALGALRWSLFFLVNVGRGSVLRPISPVACERLFGELVARAPATRPIISTTEAPHFRRVVMQRARSHHQDAPRSMGHAAGIRDGNGIMFISHTGEVHPSGFLPVSAGNVRTDHPVGLYRDADLFCMLRRADSFHGRCGRCEYRRACGGSRARAWASTGDLLAEDPLCRYEPRSAS